MQPIMNEVGDSGLARFSGYVDDEWNARLRGTAANRTFREMRDSEAVIGGFLYAIEFLLRRVKWTVEPADETPEEIAKADFVKSCMDDMDMSWQDVISEALSMLTFGWAYLEVVYKRRDEKSKFPDGRIGWSKWALRAQDSLLRWEMDEKGDVIAMIQMPPQGGELRIPLTKALHFRTTSSKNNPQGRSILRNAYRAFYYKQKIEIIEAIGVERDLAGLPVALVPPRILSSSASDDEKQLLNTIRNILKNVRRNEQEGIIFPLAYNADKTSKTYELSLLTTGGSRQFDTTKIIDRYRQEQAMTVLADFLLLGSTGTGSYALSSDKTELFTVALSAYLDMIAEPINRFEVPRLLAYNGFDVRKQPVFKHGDVEAPDLDKLGRYIATLSGAGMPMFPDPKLEAHLRRVADLPGDSLEVGAGATDQGAENGGQGTPEQAPGANGEDA